MTLVGCLLPVGVTRAAARSEEGITRPDWTDWTGWTGWRGWAGWVKLVWKRDWVVVDLVVVVAGAETGDLPRPTLPRPLCLCLSLVGRVGLVCLTLG